RAGAPCPGFSPAAPAGSWPSRSIGRSARRSGRDSPRSRSWTPTPPRGATPTPRRRRARVPWGELLAPAARTWSYAELAAPPGGPVLIVGNLPYSVGKPILTALVGAGGAIDEMALMLQREVAERVAAPPGGKTYGSLSVFTQLRCDVRLALRVPAGAFRPPPKVESAVLHL